MTFYAQIDQSNVCTSVLELHGEHASTSLIPIVEFDSTLLGKTWNGVSFAAQAAPVDPCQHLIDIGPFFDRFGAYKMAVLTSQDVVVKAIVQDVTVRKWVDLTRVDVGQALDLLISKSLLDAATKTAILTNPVTPEENRALRKQYF